MDASKYKRLLRDTGIFAFGNLGSKLILFFLVPLYTNYMTDAEYGLADLAYTVAQLIIPFVSVVIFDAVVRFGLAKNARPQDVLLNALIVCAVGSVVALAATPLLRFYSAIAEWRWYVFAYIVISMFGSVVMNYLKVKDLNKTYAFLSIVQTAVLAVSNIVLLCFLHMGVSGYLLSMNIAGGINFALAVVSGGILRDLRSSSFQRGLLKQMLLFSAPLIFNNLSWWVIQSSDKVMIDAMVGAAALGIFTVASKIPALINVMISIFSQAWGLSSVREIESTKDAGFYSGVLNAYQTVAFGAAIVLIAFVRPFMSFYVGEDFSEAWRYVPLLLASASFSAISSYYGSLYSALKKSVNNMATTMLAAVVNIAVNLVGIYYLGLWGAVLGTLVAYIVIAFARMLDVGRFIPIKVDMLAFGGNIVLVLVECASVSLDYCAVPVSVACMVCFVLINVRVVVRMLKG